MGMRLLAFLACLAMPAAHAASCAAESGPRTAALVELYTSEGCSSCPPADRWLSGLRAAGYGSDQVVPLSLHVDYWDYIGWKDPWAKREFSLRQRKLTQLQRLALVYTPQVMLQGRDFRAWHTAAFGDAVKRLNATPARARISLRILPGKPALLEVDARAELLGPAGRGEPALYLAAYQNRLESHVTRGENGGRTLAHDYVVLEWQGPFPIGPSGRVAERRALPLLPRAPLAHSGVAAFVQDRASAEVLQALMLPACST